MSDTKFRTHTELLYARILMLGYQLLYKPISNSTIHLHKDIILGLSIVCMGVNLSIGH
jgi:hypothetical protein